MKKFIAGLVVVFLVIFTGVCYASGFNFKSIPLKEATIEELLAIREEIDMELESRGYLDNEILEGVYVAGKDIGVGSYVFYFPDDYSGEKHSRIFVYQNAELYSSRKSFSSPFVSDTDGVSAILDEGYILEVAGGKCFCKPQESKKSWAP